MVLNVLIGIGVVIAGVFTVVGAWATMAENYRVSALMFNTNTTALWLAVSLLIVKQINAKNSIREQAPATTD